MLGGKVKFLACLTGLASAPLKTQKISFLLLAVAE